MWVQMSMESDLRKTGIVMAREGFLGKLNIVAGVETMIQQDDHSGN